MSKFIFTVVCVLISVSVAAETVYKKKNPDGSVEFSDQGSIDSEEVKIRKPTTYSPPPLPRLTLPTKKLKPTFNYAVTINQPANNEVIIGQTDVTVSVSIQPKLNTNFGHQIRYQLGGKSIVSLSIYEIFKDVYRGTHTLSVSIVDLNGENVSPVVSRTIHMKRFFIKPEPKKVK